MEDRICMDTELLQRISSQISQTKEMVSSLSGRLNNATSEVQRVASSQTQAIDMLYAAGDTLKQTVMAAEALASGLSGASTLWSDTEYDIIRSWESQLPDDIKQGGAGNQVDPSQSASYSDLTDAQIKRMLIKSMNYPENTNLWSKEMWDTFNEKLKDVTPVWADDGTPGIISGSSIIMMAGGAVQIFSGSSSFSNLSGSKTTYGADGSYSKEEHSAGFTTAGWDGKLLRKQDDGTYKPLKIDNKKPWIDDKRIGGKTRADRIGTIAQFGVSDSREKAAYRIGGEYKNGAVSADGSISFGKSEVHGSFQGGLYATKVDKDGNVSYHLEPGVSAKAGASYSLMEMKGGVQYGSDDLNGHVKGEVSVGKASGEGEFQFGMIGGKPQAHVKLDAEALAFEGKVTGGVTVAGIEANATASLNVGIGGHFDAGWHDGTLSLDVGATVGIGGSIKVEVDVSGFVDNVVETGSKIVNAVQNVSSSLVSFFFG